MMLGLLQRPCRNIFAIVRAVESDRRTSLIGSLHRRLQLRRACRYPEHATARSVESPIAFRGAGVKDFYSVQLRGIFEADNLLSRLVASWIAARSHHHAHGRVVRPLEITVAGPAVDRSLHRLNQVAFQ